ncbi:MAG: hypothetical protein KBT06_10470 [Prevotellaceae bacterium]|nr:hypothetical protein [Candidatus Colivivens equi]
MAFKVIGILEIIIGIIGIIFGLMMFGDIGIACLVGAIGTLLSGIAFVSVSKAIKNINKEN